MSGVKLFDGVQASTGGKVPVKDPVKSIALVLTGTGAVTAAGNIYAALSEEHQEKVATFSLSGTNSVIESCPADFAADKVWLELTSLTGTSARLQASVGV